MSKTTHPDQSTTPKAIEDCHALLAWMLFSSHTLWRAGRFKLSMHVEDGMRCESRKGTVFDLVISTAIPVYETWVLFGRRMQLR